MGGCSSKPQTSERDGHTPANQELNLILSGLKAIDPSNPSAYKGSQHTLQSLFILHHRDGEDVLENAQTLQELLQDSKALPQFENESAGNAETQLASKDLHHECKPSSPISVLAQQDAENCKLTEGLLLPREASYEGTPALSVLPEQHADHCASLDCKIHDATLEPKSHQLSSHEPNLLESNSADPVLHEIRASKAMEIAAPDAQALDAEAREVGINRHEQEVEEGEESVEMAPKSKIVEGPKEEHGMEVAVETSIQAELELEEARKILGARKVEIQNEEATKIMEHEASQGMVISEPLVVQQHDDNSAESCLESEKAALQDIEDKAIVDKKAGFQFESFMEGEKIRVQDRKHVESEKPGVQIQEDTESEKARRQRSERKEDDKTNLCESIGQEGEKKGLQDEEVACVQGVVTTVHNEHAGVPDGSDQEEPTCAKKAGTVQDDENEEPQGGLQIQKDELQEQSLETIAESTRQAKLDDVPDSTESLEKESSKLTISEEVVPPARDETFKQEQQIPNSLVEVELNKKVDDQGLGLSSSEDKKADDALLKQSVLEGNTTDIIESSKFEPSVELEHDKSNAVDSKEKEEESIEVAQYGQSDSNQLSENLESTFSRQIEKSIDPDTHTGTEADQLLRPDVKDALPIDSHQRL